VDGEAGAALQAASMRVLRDIAARHRALVLAAKPPVVNSTEARRDAQKDYTSKTWQLMVRTRLSVCCAPAPSTLLVLRQLGERGSAEGAGIAVYFAVDDRGVHFPVLS